jgi:hypothetical protein
MSTPDVYAVCIYGFGPVGAVVVTIQDPSGAVAETRTLEPEELTLFNAFTFRRLGTDVKGKYTFTAAQGAMRATTTLEVRDAKTPQFIGYEDDAEGAPDFGLALLKEPGDTIRLALGGFAPNSTVQMRIYGHPHPNSDGETVVDYLTSHPAKVDSRGVGVWSLKTVSSDPQGCYGLFSEQVTRLMYPAVGAPPIRWTVSFCLVSGIEIPTGERVL